MDAPTEMRQKAGLSDYLAAERTLLAWIRTGLALMGFGFVVARFGLFLQQLQAIQHPSSAQPYGLSLWFGTALIARWRDRECFCRMASRPIGPGNGSRGHGALSSFYAGSGDCFLPGIGRARHGDLSDFGPQFRGYEVAKC